MGISDKDYADALMHQRAHQAALMKLELEKRKEKEMAISGETSLGGLGQALNSALSPHGTNSLTNTTGSQNIAVGQVTLQHSLYPTNVAMTQSGSKVLNEQDLKHDAMLAPLSALIDMWTMRWQGEWVSESEFAEDDFWRLALIRLVGANKLEKHNLANSYSPVYRIIE